MRCSKYSEVYSLGMDIWAILCCRFSAKNRYWEIFSLRVQYEGFKTASFLQCYDNLWGKNQCSPIKCSTSCFTIKDSNALGKRREGQIMVSEQSHLRWTLLRLCGASMGGSTTNLIALHKLVYSDSRLCCLKYFALYFHIL